MRSVLLSTALGAMIALAPTALAQAQGRAQPSAPAPVQGKPAPRGLDDALDGKPTDAAPEEHRRGTRRGGWDDDDWDDWDDRDDDRYGGWDRGRGGRDARGRRGRDDTIRLTCGSEDYRYRLCEVRGRIDGVRLVRQRSWAPCREGSDWGWSARRGGLWVDNGCEAEFRVALRGGRSRHSGYGYGYGRGYGDDRGEPYAPRRLVSACLREAELAYGRDLAVGRILRAEEGRRGWTLDLRLEADRRDRWDRRDRRRGRFEVTCRSGRRGIQIAAR